MTGRCHQISTCYQSFLLMSITLLGPKKKKNKTKTKTKQNKTKKKKQKKTKTL